MSTKLPHRRVVWRRIHDDKSLEYFEASAAGSTRSMNGTIVTAFDDMPLLVEYSIQCASNGAASGVGIERAWGGEIRKLTLVADGPLRWRVDGVHNPALDGCTDIDIEWTPSTNVFPIRRLSGEASSQTEVKAAWVRLPHLTVEASSQRYTRLQPNLYRYENIASGFSADIEVDDMCLPISYGRIWSRLADWRSPA